LKKPVKKISKKSVGSLQIFLPIGENGKEVIFMCTAVQLGGFYGRTLDYECSFGESVGIAPRRLPFIFEKEPPLKSHYALLGMASVRKGIPLFYEAMNERGLYAAGLLFAGEAFYPKEGRLAPYELIPWLLGQCADLKEARERLAGLSLWDHPFAVDTPNSPLHWLIADPKGALVVEPTSEGLKVYENPLGVLTNSPDFPYQQMRVAEVRHLSAEAQPPLFAKELPIHSRGLSAVGLPGDFSSPSRFIRAAFLRAHLRPVGVAQMFQLMGAVAVPQGCLRLPGGDAFTRYTSCADAAGGAYYYTTHQEISPRILRFSDTDLESTVANFARI
jgi:choloylglycine hydrolase